MTDWTDQIFPEGGPLRGVCERIVKALSGHLTGQARLAVAAQADDEHGGAALRRCRYHGDAGMARWVGWGVIAHDLRVIAQHEAAKASRQR